jgi:hypothetical protein
VAGETLTGRGDAVDWFFALVTLGGGWVAGLDDPDFRVRERATAGLVRQGWPGALRAHLFAPDTPEARWRASLVVRSVSSHASFARLRASLTARWYLIRPGSTWPPLGPVGAKLKADPLLWAAVREWSRRLGADEPDSVWVQDRPEGGGGDHNPDTYAGNLGLMRYNLRAPEGRRWTSGWPTVHQDEVKRQYKEHGSGGWEEFRGGD